MKGQREEENIKEVRTLAAGSYLCTLCSFMLHKNNVFIFHESLMEDKNFHKQKEIDRKGRKRVEFH